MSNQLVIRDIFIPADQYDCFVTQVKQLVDSGFLPQSIKTPQQAIAIAMAGRDLGVPMMQAFATINVVQGKITVSPQLMLAKARQTGELEDMAMNYEEDGTCKCVIKRKGQAPHITQFGPTEAQAMGLLQKDNYKKQAKTMFQWRALAANLRVTFPDAIMGLYTHEEMGANDPGELVVVPVEEPTVNITGSLETTQPRADRIGDPEPDPWDKPKLDKTESGTMVLNLGKDTPEKTTPLFSKDFKFYKAVDELIKRVGDETYRKYLENMGYKSREDIQESNKKRGFLATMEHEAKVYDTAFTQTGRDRCAEIGGKPFNLLVKDFCIRHKLNSSPSEKFSERIKYYKHRQLFKNDMMNVELLEDLILKAREESE